jgi:hypothetical protein
VNFKVLIQLANRSNFPGKNVVICQLPAAGSIDIIRLRPAQRGSFTGAALAARTPSVINAGGLSSLDGVAVGPPFFNENIPLRNLAPVINDVAGALDIQEVLERAEWVSQAGDAAAYAPYLRKNPLPGVSPKSVLIAKIGAHSGMQGR